MENKKIWKAGLIVIGDEILSGRTQDKNVAALAKWLNVQGIQLAEVRIVPDIVERIAEAVNEVRATTDYLFTTGGIGPTHDDITADNVAAAFGIGIDVREDAMEVLATNYPDGRASINEARMRMARIPDGARLIDNPVSKAPGFSVENVHVMAGVPRIMQAMFDGLKPKLKGGAQVFSVTVTARIGESFMAKGLEAVQKEHPDIDIGSYPFYRSGEVGSSIVLRSTDEAELQVELDQPPPAKLPLTLLLALPRPKMLRRVLQTVSAMGVPRLILLNSYRVEKSFWQTPFLEPAAIREQLVLGLEQARDTVLPEVLIEKRFKPFVEDRLPQLSAGSLGLVGHPGPYPACPRAVDGPVTLAIGPEGGWIAYEVEKLQTAGLAPVQLGERILRVETAVSALLARLF